MALGVLDTCVIPREFADAVKARAREATGIPPERIMLSATHTHSAPSLMQALGTDADPNYPAFALPRIVEGLQRAVANLAPARVGWAAAQAPEHTHTRVWIRRPDRMLTDPFGEPTVRANMHPGYQNPDAIGPSGPSDPGLTVLAVQSPDGRPLAVLANYSMHYFGAAAVSADYYGLFAEKLRQLVAAEDAGPPSSASCRRAPAAISIGWITASRSGGHLDEYAEELARIAAEAYKTHRFPRLGAAGHAREGADPGHAAAGRETAGLGARRRRPRWRAGAEVDPRGLCARAALAEGQSHAAGASSRRCGSANWASRSGRARSSPSAA